MTIITGVGNLIEFCNILRNQKIQFNINMYSSDAITVTMTLVAARIEVEFQEHEVNYSIFRGDEAVESDLEHLFALIKKHI